MMMLLQNDLVQMQHEFLRFCKSMLKTLWSNNYLIAGLFGETLLNLLLLVATQVVEKSCHYISSRATTSNIIQ